LGKFLGQKNPVPRHFWENIYAKVATFLRKNIFNSEVAIFGEYIAKAKQDSRTFLLSSMTSFSQIWRFPLKDDHQSTLPHAQNLKERNPAPQYDAWNQKLSIC
jgi:hypothetical protein